MDLTPGPEITDAMVNLYDDSETTARIVGYRAGLRDWRLRQHEIREGLASTFTEIREAAYRAGREDAAQAILATGVAGDELPADKRILLDRDHAAAVARGGAEAAALEGVEQR